MCNFHALEVVGRGSETQLQVGGNLNYLNYLTQRFWKMSLSDYMYVLDDIK